MQSLSAGSVVCFGSTRHGQFWVDTVFVVATAQPWLPDQTTDLDLDEAFLACTAQPLTAWAETNAGCARPRTGCAPGSGLEFMLYRGATLDNPVHGMYSFVPARPADHPTPAHRARTDPQHGQHLPLTRPDRSTRYRKDQRTSA